MSKNKINPYEILGVKLNDDHATITRNHRKLILRWHPDKFKPVSTDEKEKEKEIKKAKEMYEKISKSYEILIDPKKRENYDKYKIVNQSDEQDMAEELTREMMIKDRLKEVIKISVTISDILNGINKEIKLQRQVISKSTRHQTCENITINLEIDSTVPINKPIIFEGKGKKVDNNCGDLFVILKITSDSTYKINKINNNIITTQKISVAQSLCGFEMSIPHNKNLVIQHDNIIKQDYIYTIAEMGLTISDDNDQLKKTDIEVHFDIQYPTRLDDNIIKDLKNVFKYNYKKSDSIPNKTIIRLDENKINMEIEDYEQHDIGIEQMFGGIPGMRGFGGIPGMSGFGGIPGMSGFEGIPGMNRGGGNSRQEQVECRQG